LLVLTAIRPTLPARHPERSEWTTVFALAFALALALAFAFAFAFALLSSIPAGNLLLLLLLFVFAFILNAGKDLRIGTCCCLFLPLLLGTPRLQPWVS